MSKAAEQPDVRTLFAAGLDNASLLHGCLLLVQMKAVFSPLTPSAIKFPPAGGSRSILFADRDLRISGAERAGGSHPRTDFVFDECPAGVPLVDRVVASQLAKITCPRKRFSAACREE